jgi:hypothetical protein
VIVLFQIFAKMVQKHNGITVLLHLILEFQVMMFFIENIYHVYLETVIVIEYNVSDQMVPYG